MVLLMTELQEACCKITTNNLHEGDLLRRVGEVQEAVGSCGEGESLGMFHLLLPGGMGGKRRVGPDRWGTAAPREDLIAWRSPLGNKIHIFSDLKERIQPE